MRWKMTRWWRWRRMFEISTNWLNGAGQVAIYALLIGLGLWVMSKIETKGKE